MRDYDYAHQQNRWDTLPGFPQIEVMQRGTKLHVKSKSIREGVAGTTFDRKDYTCDAEFTQEVRQWARTNS